MILNPPSPSVSESQSDPAISSLVNNKSTKKKNLSKDNVDGSLSRQSNSDDSPLSDDSPQRFTLMETTSESDNSDDNDNNINDDVDDDTSLIIDDFKVPIKVQKNSNKVKRQRNVTSRKKTLRSYNDVSDDDDDDDY